ncbi:MAG TPA: GLPGLI family protein [Flavobacteriaceae bacterium]|nr:GLPGLI family protein [Flavobacteriaceae bacterium]
MNKNILLLLSFFLFVYGSWAQIASGKITYKVEADESMMEEILKDDKITEDVGSYLRMMFSNQIRTLPYLFYQMEFNSKESLFKKMESMATDSGFDLNRTARNVGVDGAYYHSLDEDKSYHETSRAGSEIIVAHNISDFDWKITNETKTIHGYLCYKATAEFTPDLGGGEIATAWFAKDLPFQFGPAFYAGLPGMILEVKQGYYTFYADDINLSKREKKIKKPKTRNATKLEDFKEELDRIKRNYIKAQ